MGLCEVYPAVLRDAQVRQLDYGQRFALFALMALADPRGLFRWDVAELARLLSPDGGGEELAAIVLFTRFLADAERLGLVRRYEVGGREYGQVLVRVLLTSQFWAGYRRKHKAQRCPSPQDDQGGDSGGRLETMHDGKLAEIEREAQFELFWQGWPHKRAHKVKARLVWMKHLDAGGTVEEIERAALNYRLACHKALREGREPVKMAASTFIAEAWAGYVYAEGKA